MKRLTFIRFFFSTSVLCALSAAILGSGCSSDSLKRTFDKTGPTSTGATSPLSAAEKNGSASLVAGVDYAEANAAATPPVGTSYYRGVGSAVPSNAAPSPSTSFLSGAASVPASVPESRHWQNLQNSQNLQDFQIAQTSQIPSSTQSSSLNVSLAPALSPSKTGKNANFQEEERLREELIAARADVKRQIDANESLLRQNATFRRDAEEAVAELRLQNAELSEKNRILLASASELQADRAQSERRLQVQNAALRKAPTTVVVPNNSAATLELKLSDPKILPIRRDGDSAIIELQDELLFEPDSNRFSEEGEKRLRILATEILSRYPTNVLSIQGHSDADPTGADDPMSVQAASVQKAYLVAEFFVEETGVARNQTVVGGCGSVRPIVSNETETNRRRNRRVEITILPETVTPRFDSPKTISF